MTPPELSSGGGVRNKRATWEDSSSALLPFYVCVTVLAVGVLILLLIWACYVFCVPDEKKRAFRKMGRRRQTCDNTSIHIGSVFSAHSSRNSSIDESTGSKQHYRPQKGYVQCLSPITESVLSAQPSVCVSSVPGSMKNRESQDSIPQHESGGLIRSSSLPGGGAYLSRGRSSRRSDDIMVVEIL